MGPDWGKTLAEEAIAELPNAETLYSCRARKVPILIQSRKTARFQNELRTFPGFSWPSGVNLVPTLAELGTYRSVSPPVPETLMEPNF